MHFRFALDLSDLDLWNINLLDTHLDLLDADIPSKHFVCLQDVFKMYSRCFQRKNFSSSKTSSRRLKDTLRDVFKTSSRCLGDQQMFAGNQLMSSWEIKPLLANCYNPFWTCRKCWAITWRYCIHKLIVASC